MSDKKRMQRVLLFREQYHDILIVAFGTRNEEFGSKMLYSFVYLRKMQSKFGIYWEIH
jgi:hypothetical protein